MPYLHNYPYHPQEDTFCYLFRVMRKGGHVPPPTCLGEDHKHFHPLQREARKDGGDAVRRTTGFNHRHRRAPTVLHRSPIGCKTPCSLYYLCMGGPKAPTADRRPIAA